MSRHTSVSATGRSLLAGYAFSTVPGVTCNCVAVGNPAALKHRASGEDIDTAASGVAASATNAAGAAGRCMKVGIVLNGEYES
jgi:hypothetical protein